MFVINIVVYIMSMYACNYMLLLYMCMYVCREERLCQLIRAL